VARDGRVRLALLKPGRSDAGTARSEAPDRIPEIRLAAPRPSPRRLRLAPPVRQPSVTPSALLGTSPR